MKNADMPAMPCTKATGEVFEGLTKREFFALKIYCANSVANPTYESIGYEHLSGYEDAVNEADALLAELDK